MTTWTPDELTRIGRADELRIASRRPDGTLRGFVTIWVARSGDEVYVRSAHGVDNPWFRRAVASGSGRIEAGGVTRDVTFEQPEDDVHAGIDATRSTTGTVRGRSGRSPGRPRTRAHCV
jgi:hypothetical protein